MYAQSVQAYYEWCARVWLWMWLQELICTTRPFASFFFHVEFINYGSSNSHKRVIWIHVWFVSALFLIWPVIHSNCRVVSKSTWVLQIRFCFPKHWRKEINQPYVMQQMFPGQKTSDIVRSELCFVWNKHLFLHSPLCVCTQISCIDCMLLAFWPFSWFILCLLAHLWICLTVQEEVGQSVWLPWPRSQQEQCFVDNSTVHIWVCVYKSV